MGAPLRKIAVIGGGIAGLSAASKLVRDGNNVTVFESAPQLGGRARAITWKGQQLDNGQHILLGAYHQTLNLISSLGINLDAVFLRLPLTLQMQSSFSLKAKPLPAPLNLLFGLLLAKGLSWGERLAAIRFFIWVRNKDFKLVKDEPLLDLLNRHRQPPRLIKWMWEPLCLAALNTSIKTASAQIYLNVLRDSFNQNKNDSDLILPRADLSTLLANPLGIDIIKHGGEIKLKTTVDNIVKTDHGFNLCIEGKTDLEFSHVIIATSPHHTLSISHALDVARELNSFDYQPIYTVYIQYPRDVKLPSEMIGFTKGIAQWAFDRGQLCGQRGLVAVIISAEGHHQKITQEALGEAVTDELRSAFPNLPKHEWFKVIAEKRATFSCTAGLKRPSQKTSTPNLYLAGDYTEGDYPATIEGAIRSGQTCAQFILQS